MYALFTGLISLAAADIPVNCNYRQVLGSWTFHINPDTFTALLHDPRSTCGHGQPDQVAPVLLGESYSFPSEWLTSITLSEPNTALSDAWGSGDWTM